MNRLFIATLVILFPFLMNAQDYEVGLMFGSSAYSGDLNPNSHRFSTGDRHAALGLFYRKDFNRFLSYRFQFTYGKISASDANANDAGRVARNLSFQSNIIELGAMGEFNPLGNNSTYERLKPYIFGGVALFRFNPEANLNGQLVELQPLGTEGQGIAGRGSKYRRTQISIPLGLGVKYMITNNLNLGIELGVRTTFTDYLDDVSTTYVNYQDLLTNNGAAAAALGNRQGELLGGEPVSVPTGTQRGNPLNDDYYIVGGVTLSYIFTGKNRRGRGGRTLRGNEFGCPTGL